MMTKKRSRDPEPPRFLSPKATREFRGIVKQLKKRKLLAKADPALIAELALVQDQLRSTTEFVEKNGTTFFSTRYGRIYKCPACRGTGQGRGEKNAICRGCRGKGVIMPIAQTVPLEYPEARMWRWAIDSAVRLAEALGLISPLARRVIKRKR